MGLASVLLLYAANKSLAIGRQKCICKSKNSYQGARPLLPRSNKLQPGILRSMPNMMHTRWRLQPRRNLQPRSTAGPNKDAHELATPTKQSFLPSPRKMLSAVHARRCSTEARLFILVLSSRLCFSTLQAFKGRVHMLDGIGG